MDRRIFGLSVIAGTAAWIGELWKGSSKGSGVLYADDGRSFDFMAVPCYTNDSKLKGILVNGKHNHVSLDDVEILDKRVVSFYTGPNGVIEYIADPEDYPNGGYPEEWLDRSTQLFVPLEEVDHSAIYFVDINDNGTPSVKMIPRYCDPRAKRFKLRGHVRFWMDVKRS